MRGDDQQQDGMFSYISPDKRVPQDHPLRRIRVVVDRVLEHLSPRFNKLYARAGRPSIAPEKLLRALLLQLLYSVRSERLLMEQLDYNLLFRWFVGLSMDDAVWDASTFSKNRERMLEGNIAEAFFQGVLGEARAGQLLSDEHFTVDGTLLEAWASHKSFRPVNPVAKDKNDQEPKPPAARWDENNPTIHYRGEKRSNQTHCSTTDPEAMLARKGARKGSQVELPRTPDDRESERTRGEHTGDHGLRLGGVSCRVADGGTVARLREIGRASCRERCRSRW